MTVSALVPSPTRPRPGGVGVLAVQQVPLALLQTDPENPRRVLPAIDELAASMARDGLVQPVIARVDGRRLVVVAGHRRVAAAQLLGWRTIPTIINRAIRPDRVLGLMLAENGHREPLDPVEEAAALAELQRREGLTLAGLARRVSRSVPWVSGRLGLLQLDSGQRAQVRAGQLSLRAAAEVIASLNAPATARRRPAAQPGGAPGWHLTLAHPLAPLAADRCARAGHGRARRLPGSQACGACWEAAIRSDAVKGGDAS